MAVGIETRTSARSTGGAAVVDGDTYFLVGVTERGSTTEPIGPLRSMADYARLCGSRVASGFVYDDLQTFFAEGGAVAWLGRVVGAGATVGNLTLNDGSAVPTLRIDAYGPGAWSENVTVTVEAGTIAGTIRVLVTVGTEVERYDNLASISAIIAALENSAWVRGVDLGSVSANPLPAVAAAAPLSAGAAGAAPVLANYTAALALFPASLGTGFVAIPGQPLTSTAQALKEHCKSTDRVTGGPPAKGSTPTQVAADAASIRSAITDEEYVGLFYPWVLIPDGAGGSRTIPPEGYVAAKRAKALREFGDPVSPAGQNALADFVIGTERNITDAENNTLDDAAVSVIREIAGVRLYGWRSLSPDLANYKNLTARETMNFVVVEGRRRLEQFAHRTIDPKGQLFGEVYAEMYGIVGPMAERGALWPLLAPDGVTQIDDGFLIDTGPSINPAAQMAQDIAAVHVSLRTSPTGALIRLFVTKVGLTTPF